MVLRNPANLGFPEENDGHCLPEALLALRLREGTG